jgi:hypothetical protein
MAAAQATPESAAGLQLSSGPENCADIMRPIVRLGVSGHRDLADTAAACDLVIQAIGVVLRILDIAIRPRGILRFAQPPAVSVGYQVISPLAEGADRVVADSVLSADPDLSARPRELVVPLPFSLHSYRGTDGHPGSDCSDAASQAEFDRLRSAACWTRPLDDSAPSDQAERDAGYREVGRFVVMHSDVLIALWDGSDNQSKVGTAATVRLALRRGIPVVWIPVTRRGRPEAGTPSDAITEPRLLLDAETWDSGPDGSLPPILQRAVESSLSLASPMAARVLGGHRRAQLPLQELVVERLRRTQELEWAASADLSAPPAAGAGADAGAGYTSQLIAYTARWIEEPYARADSLAKKYQRRLRYLTIGVYAAAATAVALGAFAAILFPYGGNWRLAVIFEALVLVALLTVQWLDLRTTCRDRWVAYRAMTEYMRVGRYLALVTPELSTALDFNRVARPGSWSSEPSLTPWFAPALQRLWDRWPDVDPAKLDVGLLSSHLVHDWIDAQIDYHQRRRDTHRRWDRYLTRAIRLTLFATVLAVMLHAIRDYAPAFLGRSTGSRDLIAVLLAFLTIVLTSIAAAFNGYSGQQRHSFHHARFRRMATELIHIRGAIERATTIDELRHGAEKVRRVTLGETTDWFEDMRDQLIDSPT